MTGARTTPFLALGLVACATTGSAFLEDPEVPEEESGGGVMVVEGSRHRPAGGPRRRVIGGEPEELPEEGSHAAPAGSAAPIRDLRGRVLGTFRNTYYDFPDEREHGGPPVALKSAGCETLRLVPREFHDAVCVQGSGMLASGSVVSFARRDCECAELCPRTQQRICFDELDRARFPWGRGATGKPITPLLTVAVDSDVIPLGTPLYIPELAGLPREEGGTARHDGCFLAQDRGMKVKGKHVDIFTGLPAVTRLWNSLVPSNQGVTVVLDSPRCARGTEGPPAGVEPAPPPRRRRND